MLRDHSLLIMGGGGGLNKYLNEMYNNVPPQELSKYI